ncbi:hypothetical protein [uncultured Psychrosphaera sp.]|uniref:hypothetical protein n=1 Tax=uncultured Psychrosphaera sp. TaxID=1403522 RepID=UPI0026188A27|nr:hypothetical protein [uncultured Psychrosphaera sp.]
MQEQPLFIATIEPVSADTQLVTLVNSTDETALPHTHLYTLQEGKAPLLLVTGNALFTGVAVSVGRYVYFAGYNGHVITNCPDFHFTNPSQEDIFFYEPNEKVEFRMGRVTDSDIVLSIGLNKGNRIIFFAKDGSVLIYSNAGYECKTHISADPVCCCQNDKGHVYVGTEEGRIWLLDGKKTNELSMPETGLPRAVISGITVAPTGDIYVVSRNGFIAKKTIDNDFLIIKAPINHYNGVAFIAGIMYVSAREGLFSIKELDGEITLIPLRNTFNPLSMLSYRNELFLTSANPRATPYFVKAIPGNNIDKLEACYTVNLSYEAK